MGKGVKNNEDNEVKQTKQAKQKAPQLALLRQIANIAALSKYAFDAQKEVENKKSKSSGTVVRNTMQEIIELAGTIRARSLEQTKTFKP